VKAMKEELKIKIDLIKLLQIIFGNKGTVIILRLLLVALLIYRIDIFLYYWKGIAGFLSAMIFIIFFMKKSDKKTQEMIEDVHEHIAKRFERELTGEKEGVKFRLLKATEYENKNLHIFNKNNQKISISGEILLFQNRYEKNGEGNPMKTAVFEKDFKVDGLRANEGEELIIKNAPRWTESFRIEAEIIKGESKIKIDCESKREFTFFDLEPIIELSSMEKKFLGYRLYWLKEQLEKAKVWLGFYCGRRVYGYPRFSKTSVFDFVKRNSFRLSVFIVTIVGLTVVYVVMSDFVSFLRFIGGALYSVICSIMS